LCFISKREYIWIYVVKNGNVNLMYDFEQKMIFNLFREQLLNVLLRITTLVLNKKPPRRKEDTLSGKLAPAIFQVLK